MGLREQFKHWKGWPQLDRDRWSLWSPVLLGLGIAGYFTLPSEPAPWMTFLPSMVLGLALLLLGRRHEGSTWILWALLLVSLGVGAAQTRTYLVAAPVLEREGRYDIRAAEVSWVEARGGKQRLYLQNPKFERPKGFYPKRIRISVSARQPLEIQPGQIITLSAVLRPPPGPAMPGAYDFARRAYFQQLGAVGYGWGVEVLPAPPLSEQPAQNWNLFWNSLRYRISERIDRHLEDQVAAVAKALTIGDRSGISDDMQEAMRRSGLAHLLAISGLHMGLVAGLVFLFVRGVLALIPAAVLYHPTKKWAAVPAFFAVFAFLFLAGATLPTQRAFLMISVVLLAVLLDRRAISLRLVAWAAVVILVLRPESLLSASFQMSFAAVTALIALYEGISGGRLFPYEDRRWWHRLLLYFGALALTSVVAVLATGPFAGFHFNRVVAYGPLANLIAVPLTAFWIMPTALAAFVFMPIGFEGPFLVMMGWGLELLLAVAQEVSQWPYAQIPIPAISSLCLGIIALGGLWLAIWRQPWRWAGLVVVVLALSWGLSRPTPDLWISADANLRAFKEGEQLWLSSLRKKKFEGEVWQRRAGVFERRDWRDHATLRCDAIGCLLTLQGQRIAFLEDERAIPEDCGQADIVLASVPVRPWLCAEPLIVIDRFHLARRGGHVLWLADDDNHRILTVEDWRGDRPWTRQKRRGANRPAKRE